MIERRPYEADLRHRKVWERFVSGTETDLLVLPSSIRDSWRRSRRRGNDPRLMRAPSAAVVHEPRLGNDPDDALRHWSEHAEAACRFVRAALSFPHQLLLLSDRNGRLAAVEAGAKARRRAEELNVTVGADWSETAVGCTAIGACLHERAPVLASWFQSYSCNWHDWVNQAVPIVDPATKRLIGALNIGGFREIVHPTVRQIMESALELIHLGITRDDWQRHARLLERYHQTSSKYPQDACLAFDRCGRLVALNPGAREDLGLSNAVIGQALEKCGELAEFLALTPDSDDPLITGIHATSHDVVTLPTVGLEGRIFVLPRRTRSRPAHAWPTRYSFADLVGTSDVFLTCIESAKAAAHANWPILIRGESGTGKELIAQAIHAAGPRRPGPFVAFNCAGISDELIAAELFGYTGGSFTGAAKDGRIGKLEAAHGGTLFLDDVECMPIRMQASLLRVLEEGLILPLGASAPKRVDVRVIAATNCDLLTACGAGTFRHDLYHRLNVILIEPPPLRERRDDIAAIASHLFQSIAPGKYLAEGALASLTSYSWPGNVRELRNVLVRASLMASGNAVNHIPLPTTTPNEPTAPQAIADAQFSAEEIQEREQLIGALALSNRVTDVADHLGIHFTSVYRRIRKYGLKRPARA